MGEATATRAPILDQLHHVTDLDAAGDFEKKHTPHIEITKAGDKYEVTVAVGYYFPHPNQPDHFIQWIDLVVGDADVMRFDLSPMVTWPTVSVIVDAVPGTVARAIEYCNLHGRWAAEATLG